MVWQFSRPCTRLPSWPWGTTIPHFRMDLFGRGTGYWVIPFTFSLSVPPASLSLHALFQTLRRHKCRLLRQRLICTSTTIPRMRRSQSPSVFYRRLRTSWYSAYFIGPYFCYCGLLNSAERIDVELVGCTSTLAAHNVGDGVLESSGSFTPPTHLDVPGCRT